MGSEQIGQEPCPRRPGSAAAALNSQQGVAADGLGVVTREQRPARRPAAGRVVELREAEAVFGQRIQIRRRNLAAVAADVAVAEVVGKD